MKGVSCRTEFDLSRYLQPLEMKEGVKSDSLNSLQFTDVELKNLVNPARSSTKLYRFQIKVKVTLRLTVSQSGTHDQMFVTVWRLLSCLVWRPL
jgi:hypothetical protein